MITVSSGGMYTARLDADDPQLEKQPEFDGARFYAHAKRAQVVLNRVWAEKVTADRIAFYAMHPAGSTPRACAPRFPASGG